MGPTWRIFRFVFFIAELGFFSAWMVTLAGKITKAHLPTWRIFHFVFFIAELGFFSAWMVTLAGEITKAHPPTWRICHFVFFYRGARFFLRLDGYISRENNRGASADVAHLSFRFFLSRS